MRTPRQVAIGFAIVMAVLGCRTLVVAGGGGAISKAMRVADKRCQGNEHNCATPACNHSVSTYQMIFSGRKLARVEGRATPFSNGGHHTSRHLYGPRDRSIH
jgi:hypothetical protein